MAPCFRPPPLTLVLPIRDATKPEFPDHISSQLDPIPQHPPTSFLRNQQPRPFPTSSLLNNCTNCTIVPRPATTPSTAPSTQPEPLSSAQTSQNELTISFGGATLGSSSTAFGRRNRVVTSRRQRRLASAFRMTISTRKRNFALSFPEQHPPTAKYARIACRRAPRRKMVHLLDLSDDVLVNILTHVMAPAKEGFRKIITEEGMRASLPISMTCRALYSVWKRSMHDLELWVSGKIDDRGLVSICRANGPHIHRLGIRKCHKLTRPALELLPRLCPNLRSLDLSGLALSDAVVTELAARAGSSLHFLALHGCSGLSERAFTAIGDHCTALRFLDVGSIPVMTDSIIARLTAKLGGALRTLIVSNCTALTDEAMARVGAHCGALMSLTMRRLPLVTDAGLAALCKGIGARVQILDVLDCTGLTLGGYFAAMELHCPHVFRYLEESNYVEHFGERCLRDNIIATMPGLIYRISATDAFRRRPALYFLLLDESTLRPFRVSVQSKSLNLSDFGTVLISNFGKRPTIHTKHVLLERFGYDSPSDDVETGCQSD